MTVLAWLWRYKALVLLVIVIALAVFAVQTWRRAGAVEAQLAAKTDRAKQEHDVKEVNVAPTIEFVPQPVVDTEAAKAVKRLTAEKKKLEDKIGKMEAVMAISAQTEPVPAQVPLAQGEKIYYVLHGASFRGNKGAEVLLLDVGALRVGDTAEIGRAPLFVDRSKIFKPEPVLTCPTERTWRAGPVIGYGTDGYEGGAVITRRLNVWGWKPDVLGELDVRKGGGSIKIGFPL